VRLDGDVDAADSEHEHCVPSSEDEELCAANKARKRSCNSEHVRI